MEQALAPNLLRTSRRGPFGRVRRDESPVSTVMPLARAAIAVMKRRVVPEFAASITSSGTLGFPFTPWIISLSSFHSIEAPNNSEARIVASVSAEIRGRLMIDSFERAARVIAL